MGKLTEKQRQFAYEFAQCGNASEAARRAGYKQPHVKSAQLMKLPEVRQELEALTEKVRESKLNGALADMAEINEFWTKIIRGEIGEVIRAVDPATGEEKPLTIPAKISDRIKASELRAKVQGAFIDRQEVTVGARLEDLIK